MSDTPDTTISSITSAELASKLDANEAFVVDIRMKATGEQIPGSRQYDAKQLLDAEPLVLPMPKDGLTVVVDNHGDEKDLGRVVERLGAAGFANVRILEGGFKAWSEAELPTEELSMKQPVAGAAGHQLFR